MMGKRIRALQHMVLCTSLATVGLGAQTKWEHVRFLPVASNVGPTTVYDSTRGRVVHVDHYKHTAKYYQDTWEWDGSTWTRIEESPQLGGWGAMAYDPVRQRTVYFGGLRGLHPGNLTLQGKTFEYDGSAWTEVSSTGPAPRRDHVMVWDPVSSRVLLYGGSDSTYEGSTPLGNETYMRDLWAWDGSSWQQLDSSGPPRGQHSLAFDSQRNRLILFGGRDGTMSGAVVNTTYEWDGSSWTPQVFATPPPRRHFGSACYDPIAGRTVLFGGRNASGNLIGDTWQWDGSTWTQLGDLGFTSTDYEGRPSLHWDTQNQRLQLMTGLGSDNTARFRIPSAPPQSNGPWTLLPDVQLREDSYFRLAYDSNRGRTVMFGGERTANQPSSDERTLEWDGQRWTVAATTGPPVRSRYSIAFDSARGTTLLFGGRSDLANVVFNDTWTWNGSNWTQQASAGPNTSVDCAMAFDDVRQRMVLFGGRSAGGASATVAETWEWDGTSWTQIPGQGPAPRLYASMAYDSARGRMVMHGGQSTAFYSGVSFVDTWEWDGTAWQDVTPASGVNPGSRGAMVYDASLQAVVKVSGQYTYAWNGNNWRVVDSLPGPYSSLVMNANYGDMVYDTGHQCLLQVSSRTSQFTDVVWMMAQASLQTNAPSSTTPYGTGCGAPALTASAGAPPIVGSTGSIVLSDVPTALSFVAAGTSDQIFNGYALPVSLASIGMQGCDLLQSADLGSFAAMPGSGTTATWSLAIPQSPLLVGVSIYLQGYAVAPGANPLGVIVSNGIAWIFGTT